HIVVFAFGVSGSPCCSRCRGLVPRVGSALGYIGCVLDEEGWAPGGELGCADEGGTGCVSAPGTVCASAANASTSAKLAATGAAPCARINRVDIALSWLQPSISEETGAVRASSASH